MIRVAFPRGYPITIPVYAAAAFSVWTCPQAVAHNIRDTTAAYLKPPLLSPEEWSRECAANAVDAACVPPQPLIPVVLDGFDGLAARMDAQDEQSTAFLQAAEVRERAQRRTHAQAYIVCVRVVCMCVCAGCRDAAPMAGPLNVHATAE